MKRTRSYIQTFFFMLIALIALNKTLAEVGSGIPLLSEASLHALCPFGGVVTLYNLATLGLFIQKIHTSAVILMSIIFVLSILFGPVFCGWVCPLGTIQEWVGKAGKKVFKKRYNTFVPKTIDRYLRYLRYGVLLWVVFVTARSGYLMFEQVDPYNALFTFWSNEVEIPALVILSITLILSLFVERPWCKYACPYGALLGLTNKFRLFKLKRTPSTCISCNKCTKNCPMNIDVANQEIITDLQCISCFECTSERSCPVTNTVNMATKPNKKIKLIYLGVVVLILIFGGIGATMAMDVWTTTSTKVPVKFKSGEAAGEYNPADIRGSYTFQQISDVFDIELSVLYEAFLIPMDTKGDEIQSKNLEALFGDSGVEIGNESMQLFVGLYKNLPIELDGTVLPKEATQFILDNNTQLTEEQRAYLETHTVQVGVLKPLSEGIVNEVSASATDSGTSSAGENETTENVVNGSATFQKVLDAGVTREEIEMIIQSSLPPTNQTVKDYCIANGLTFSSIKEQLNALID